MRQDEGPEDEESTCPRPLSKALIQTLSRERGQSASHASTSLYLHGCRLSSIQVGGHATAGQRTRPVLCRRAGLRSFLCLALQGLEDFPNLRVLHLEQNCISSCQGLVGVFWCFSAVFAVFPEPQTQLCHRAFTGPPDVPASAPSGEQQPQFLGGPGWVLGASAAQYKQQSARRPAAWMPAGFPADAARVWDRSVGSLLALPCCTQYALLQSCACVCVVCACVCVCARLHGQGQP